MIFDISCQRQQTAKEHQHQSLSFATAINTKFSELFSPKRIYVKYKNAILSRIGCSFRTWKFNTLSQKFQNYGETPGETRIHCRNN